MPSPLPSPLPSPTGPPDSDNDGIPDSQDNCPFLAGTIQTDQDYDGVGDGCDNCLFIYNPEQTDSVGNGIGDACRSLTTDTCDGCIVDTAELSVEYDELIPEEDWICDVAPLTLLTASQSIGEPLYYRLAQLYYAVMANYQLETSNLCAEDLDHYLEDETVHVCTISIPNYLELDCETYSLFYSSEMLLWNCAEAMTRSLSGLRSLSPCES